MEQPDLKKRLIDEILAVSLTDTVKARQLFADGHWERVQPKSDQPRVRSQEKFLELAAANVTRRLEGMPPPEIHVETGPSQQKRRHRKRQSG